MSILDTLFGNKKRSANEAANRLRLVLAHERVNSALPFLEDLKRDLEEVVKKYVSIEDIVVKSDKNQNIDFLEIEIKLDKR